MKLTIDNIIFDSPIGAYYPGTNVTGRLEFTLCEPKKIRGIEIKFHGDAQTSWDETESSDDNSSKTTSFTGNEEYFSNKYYLVGGPNSEIELPPGPYVYTFSTLLPPILPSSFEGAYGKIRYLVKVTLFRPWKFDQHLEKTFTVVSPVDLNHNEKAKAPVHLQLEKHFCCLWCRSGPLTVVIRLPHSGYVPGQFIPVTLEIDNTSNLRVDNVIVKLEKVMKWKSTTPRNKEREDKTEIVRMSLEAVEPNGSKSFTQQLAVPLALPCSLDTCSIIKCLYNLQVVAEVSGCHFNLRGDVPIFLGTVPLYYSVPTAPPPSAVLQPTIGFNVHPGLTQGVTYPEPYPRC